MESDSSDSENCVLCGDDSGDLLVCSVVSCSIAVHESCMEFEPLIDKNGKFYCAHCAYLRSFRRTQKLKRKAMEAKEVLVRYIKSFRVGGDVNVGNETIIRINGGGDRNVGEVEPNKNGVDNVGCVGVGGKEIEHMEMDTNVVNGNGGSYGGGDRRNGGGDRNVEGDVELSKGDEDEDNGVGNVRCIVEGKGVDGGRMQSVSAEVEEIERVEMNANVGNGNLDGQRVSEMHEIDKSNKDDTCDGFYQGDEDGNRVCDENEGKSQEKERMERGGAEVPVDTVAPDSGDFYLGSPLLSKKRVKQRAQRTVVVPYAVPLTMQPSPLGKSSHGQRDTLEGDSDKQKEKAATSSSETKEIPESNRNGKETITSSNSRKVPDLDQHEKITTSTETSKIPESASESLLEIGFKQRRQPWTAEEVNMLRKGVRAYAVQVKKNLPWRKILEFGKDVFHKTRTPDNLKDKWKNMSKELSNKQET